MLKIWYIILFFLFSLFSPAFAQPSIKSEVDKKQISLGDNITYKITINSEASVIPELKIPVFKGFNVLSDVQSSNVSLGSEGIKTTLIRAFILQSVETGKFKIEPSSVILEGKNYMSAEIEIEVKPGKIKPQQLPKKPQNKPLPEQIPSLKEDQITL